MRNGIPAAFLSEDSSRGGCYPADSTLHCWMSVSGVPLDKGSWRSYSHQTEQDKDLGVWFSELCLHKSAISSGQSPQAVCHPADVWTESLGHPVWSTRQIVITNSDRSPGTCCECASGNSVFEINRDDSSPTLTPLYVIWHGREPPLLHPVTLGQPPERQAFTLQCWAVALQEKGKVLSFKYKKIMSLIRNYK